MESVYNMDDIIPGLRPLIPTLFFQKVGQHVDMTANVVWTELPSLGVYAPMVGICLQARNG